MMTRSIQPHRPRTTKHGPRTPVTSAIILWCSLHLIGCGSGVSTVPVSGEVSWEEKPVEIGEISFTPIAEKPGPATGGAIEAGRYELSAEHGLQKGATYIVQIEATRKSGRHIPDPFAGTKTIEVMENYIPETYNARSKLRVTIEKDSSSEQLDFHLPQE